jgi:hypothetical protein
MIIKNSERRLIDAVPGRSFLFVLLMIAGLLILFSTQSVFKRPDKAVIIDPEVIYCDADSVEGDLFIKNGSKFRGGPTQSENRSLSGTYSSMLGGDVIYGIQYDIENPIAGKRYKASVWVSRTSTRGRLAVSCSKPEILHREISIPDFKRPDGWELLNLYFTIPREEVGIVKVYAYVPSDSGPTYFDDFTIREVRKGTAVGDDWLEHATLNLSIDSKGIEKLSKKKWDAVATGILITEDNDWVDGELFESVNEELPVKVRLKGDWLDHVRENKWSLRVKIKDPYSLNQMTTFSLQSPATRNYLREWIFHQHLTKEDVLSPRYDFLNLWLNGKDIGIYALEEHFEKHLVEFKERREGPILKLTEEGFWLAFQRQNDFYGDATIWERLNNAMWHSEIRPFKESKTMSDSVLAKQFELAQNLLFEFKYKLTPVSQCFDIDRLARFYVIMDVNQAYHALAWHNHRFYFNPVTAKLEPIGFDGFGTDVTTINESFLGNYINVNSELSALYPFLFSDPVFYEKYLHYLELFTRNDYLERFYLDLEEDILYRQNLIQTEFKDYTFDREDILKNARKIRFLLFPYPEISLQVRTESLEGDKKTVSLINKHGLPLEVIGFSSKTTMTQKLDSALFLFHSLRHEVPKKVALELPSYANYVFFRVPGIDSLFYSTIAPWQAPEKEQALPTPFTEKIPVFVQALGDAYLISRGEYVLTEDLIIPEGKQLIIEAGTSIDIVNQSKLLSYSFVTMLGTEDAPIRIFSSDRTGNGFTVLQADNRSILSHVHFRDLNTLSESGWTLTGAVTFYESDVSFNKVSISENLCEDGLNTIRCNFDIDGMSIANTAGDGFDADFCVGTIRNIRFTETTNDAMDFSGSQIKIFDCNISGAGDKGISVGEDSNVEVVRAIIKDSNIGVASKDLSLLKISNIELDRVVEGFTAYQKKPEFGPAELIVNNFTARKVKHLHLIEKGSLLKLKNLEIKGE